MGNDPGRGGRPDEPPPLATVRRLHLDAVDGSSATATDEWYETERLTGHITGGARSAPTADRPSPSRAAAPVVLDWRHAPAAPSPTALQRLGRTLAVRPRRRGAQDSDVPSPARTRGAQPVSALAAASRIEPPTIEPEEGEPAAVKTPAAAPSGPRIGLRESVDASGPDHRPHPRLRRAAIVIAVVLGVAAVSVIGIVAETHRTVLKPHPTSLTAAASRPSDAGLNTAAKTVTGALEALARQADKSRRQRRTVRARQRTRHPTRGRARPSSRRAAINLRHSAPPVTTPTTTPSTSGSSSVSPAGTSSYSSSSSSPAYSSQPAASESAPTAAKSVPLPAGPLGPGGTVGTNCNPKCS